MSVDTIGAAIVALLVAAGCKNVSEEEEIGFDLAKAVEDRVYDGRTHFWQVKISEAPPAGGIGYLELRHRVMVEGYIGVSRDAPLDGTISDREARSLQRAVVQMLAKAASISVSGTALGSEQVTPEPIVTTTVVVGTDRVPVHRIRVSYLVMEDA